MSSLMDSCDIKIKVKINGSKQSDAAESVTPPTPTQCPHAHPVPPRPHSAPTPPRPSSAPTPPRPSSAPTPPRPSSAPTPPRPSSAYYKSVRSVVRGQVQARCFHVSPLISTAQKVAMSHLDPGSEMPYPKLQANLDIVQQSG
ncbi:uncharacterized protein LOC126993404 isoform X2 [Eriocheir sinensis]|uniref:uncharacterized protein LOC126993404 isoform X2 n=1 Tax=Eriocheir sinensis TaxID=95602 RepID=UPI0021C6005D|nr:uncharacterized protein LOC126993404 isoform X2 [Eriocheir sinensis]